MIFRVRDIVLRIFDVVCSLFGGDGLDDPRRDADGHGTVRDDHPFRHQRPGPDDAVFPDDAVVQQGGVHPDQGAVALLNHCVVGKNCIIGAGALVPEGMVIPDGSVAVGVPAKIIKPVTEAQIAANLHNAAHYVEHGKVHARELKITAD